MSECNEIADGVSDDTLRCIQTYEEARVEAKRIVGDDSQVVLDNVAWRIWQNAKALWRKEVLD